MKILIRIDFSFIVVVFFDAGANLENQITQAFFLSIIKKLIDSIKQND